MKNGCVRSAIAAATKRPPLKLVRLSRTIILLIMAAWYRVITTTILDGLCFTVLDGGRSPLIAILKFGCGFCARFITDNVPDQFYKLARTCVPSARACGHFNRASFTKSSSTICLIHFHCCLSMRLRFLDNRLQHFSSRNMYKCK